MRYLNNDDTEFIREVRKKINYIQYVKNYEIQTKKFKRKKMCRILSAALILSVILSLILVPVIITKRLDVSFVYILGILILSLSSCYDCYAKEILE